MNEKKNNATDLPLGLSMAMAQYPLAYGYFAKLTPDQRDEIISDSRQAHSKNDMQNIIDSMCNGEMPSKNRFS